MLHSSTAEVLLNEMFKLCAHCAVYFLWTVFTEPWVESRSLAEQLISLDICLKFQQSRTFVSRSRVLFSGIAGNLLLRIHQLRVLYLLEGNLLVELPNLLDYDDKQDDWR